MIIKEIFEQLVTSEHPVAKALHSGEHFRVLAIGFKAGMKLKEHQAHMPSKLTVLTGEVIYLEGEKEVKLGQYAEVNIPVNTLHSVEAIQDSLCLLTQGLFMKEIESVTDIEFLVDEFYQKVIVDELLGRFFTIVVNFEWEVHIPIMVSFWETVLFGKASYKGNPMNKHIELDKLSKLEPVHFERWLELWKSTINENFIGEKAAEAIAKAETIAKLMQNKLDSKITLINNET